MNENIRKACLNILERLNENIDYQGRITKADTKFALQSLAAYLSYYALNPLGFNNKGEEYLLSGTELFNLLKSSSIDLEEVWNLIDIINSNSYVLDATQHKYIIPSFPNETDKVNLPTSFENCELNNVGKLVQDLETSKSKISESTNDSVIGLNILFEDINNMLKLLNKAEIEQNQGDTIVNKTKQSEVSFVLKRLSKVLMVECGDNNYEELLGKNKGEEESDSSAESDFGDSENENSLPHGLSKGNKEFDGDKEIDDDDDGSLQSDKGSENLENNSTSSDKKEFDFEGEELDNSENDIDYFEDVPGDVSDVKYKDFYKDSEDDRSKDRDTLEMDDDVSSEENDSSERRKVEETKSAFELKEEKKKKRISKLEEDLLKSKPWTLQGEVDASQRPFNSLLEEVVEVDLSQRPPPVITRKRTKKLHNIICEIILNKAFDDVEKKERPVSNVNEFKNKIVLDQEKSKLSLAEIYEKKYLKEMESKSNEEKEEAESAEKREIRELMHSVITKLQALSNLYFVPKPAIPELRVVSNLPAVAVEEVAPIVMSHDKLLAPEEVSGTSKRLEMDKEERTATDKKRERRKKKLLQKYRAKHASKNKDITNISGKKYKNTEVLTESSNLKQLKTSKTFFDHLQEKQESNAKGPKNSKVTNILKGDPSTMKKNKKRKPDIDRLEPKKIKL